MRSNSISGRERATSTALPVMFKVIADKSIGPEIEPKVDEEEKQYEVVL